MNVQEITKQYNVNIKFPERPRQSRPSEDLSPQVSRLQDLSAVRYMFYDYKTRKYSETAFVRMLLSFFYCK